MRSLDFEHAPATRTPEHDEAQPSTARRPSAYLRPDEVALRRAQERAAGQREADQDLGARLLMAAMADPSAFFERMRAMGAFAEPDPDVCGSFEEAKAQLVARWIARDTAALGEQMRCRGTLNEALALWLSHGRDAGAWLWVWGPYGCGKTFQAARLIEAIHERAGRSILPESRPDMWHPDRLTARAACTATYVVEADLVRSLMPSSTSPRDHAWWASRPLLIVDEACAGSGSAWHEEQLYTVYDQRYRDRRPTVFLSNWHPADAGKPSAWDSGRLASRLMQRLGGEALPWAVELRGDWRRGGGL